MTSWPGLRGMRAAFVFLTRLPVGGFPYTEGEWRWAAAYFPLVGTVVGALAGWIDRALAPLGLFPAALGAIGASLLVTGAFHEDGFADTCDALGGASDREKVFVILKDSRVGTFGACALVLSVVGRAALLARLGPKAPWALALVGTAARVGPIWQIATMRYATPASVARSPAVTRARSPQALVGTAWASTVAAVLVALRWTSASRMASAFAAIALVTMLTGLHYRRRVGGITGDFMGATEQLCELAAFGVLAWGPA
jgi:adenosylcobinamide-GDP ribazoletransferase